MKTPKQRVRKWAHVFYLLEQAAKHRSQELAAQAADWAFKWSHNGRLETSFGLVTVEIIDGIIADITRGANVNDQIKVLKAYVARQANVTSIQRVQAFVRKKHKRSANEEEIEAALQEALVDYAANLKASKQLKRRGAS